MDAHNHRDLVEDHNWEAAPYLEEVHNCNRLEAVRHNLDEEAVAHSQEEAVDDHRRQKAEANGHGEAADTHRAVEGSHRAVAGHVHSRYHAVAEHVYTRVDQVVVDALLVGVALDARVQETASRPVFAQGIWI